MPLLFDREIGYRGETFFIPHHLSHAASAFLVSPFEEAVILTADGVGEWATMSYGIGRGSEIKIAKEIRYPDSLGLLYTAVTTYLGFEALEGEGKVMGLAGYGKPVFLDQFKKIVTLYPDGSFRLDQRFFGFNEGSRMYRKKFIALFGKERKNGEAVQQRHCDIAASIQKFLEDALINALRKIHKEFGIARLCLGGGVFLNCVANGRILEETPFSEVFIQPAAGDSGGALGAASYIYNTFLGNARNYTMADAYLGPEFSDSHIERILLQQNLEFKELAGDSLMRYVAEKIFQNRIVGWFQGKMEFGPRALGNRSILANPCNPGMKDMLNAKVKNREPFRPYAPAVLEERVSDYFEAKQFSPFMLLAAKVREDKKEMIPAVTHIDGTARVQIVNKTTNPKFWSLLRAFEGISGVPMVINTSFNLRGEPIVCSPAHALDDFLRSEMDVLVMGNFVLEK
jgi:carbamoyltransferase